MGTSSSMAEAVGKIDRAVNASGPAMAKAGGKAAKEAVLKAAAASLGGDRKMSGLKKGGALDASVSGGGDSVTVSLHGPWGLAEKGRRKTQIVRGRIFRTPAHPSWAFRSGPSRGLKTLTNAGKAAEKEVPPAAVKAMQTELGRTL